MSQVKLGFVYFGLTLFSIISQCFAQTATPNSGTTAPFVANMQHGPWKLTDITMTSLLNDGYQIISTETLLTLSTGVVVGAGAASAAESSYLGYYLKKGPTLFRCTEEGRGATMVYCWNFAPQKGPINGQQQRDINPNPLIGKWTGVSIDQLNGTANPFTIEFTDDPQDPEGVGAIVTNNPDLQSWNNLKVLYSVTSQAVTIEDVKGTQYMIVFEIKSDDHVSFKINRDAFPTLLTRVGERPTE